jgi:hypothetical protein
MSLSGLLINRVDVVKFSDPINVSGTNAPTSTTTASVPASVQQSSAAPRTDQDIEGTTATGAAFFDHDPGVRSGDHLLYGSRILVCSGPAIDEAGRGIVFKVRWDEVL